MAFQLPVLVMDLPLIIWVVISWLMLCFGVFKCFDCFISLFEFQIKKCQGTAAGGTMEIVVNGTTGLLHHAGKEGVTSLARNIVKLATHVERRLTMGKRGYERVKERFLEHHMADRVATVLTGVLRWAKSHSDS